MSSDGRVLNLDSAVISEGQYIVDKDTIEQIQRLREIFLLHQEHINKISNEIAGYISTFNDGLKASADFLRNSFSEVIKEQRKAEIVEASGWLPHSTTPFHLIVDENLDKTEVSEILKAFYIENWKSVEEKFLISVKGYNIDEEAKSTFREALQAHGRGLYRASVRTLFPEIERVASREFYAGKHRDEKRRPITSLTEIRGTVHDLPAGDVISYDYGIRLFKKIESHLYAHVGEDDAEIARFLNDHVPNRHAALHGIISYSTMQNSLNTLIMADFMFHVMSKMKKYIVKENSEH